ncbi:RING-H2 finger protein ATL7-like [Corylus avellana]|uniref:RING-H2 finger protein ATL7-like n=1 Tax=Corylus avellana TaxID=13451 RepID=UPI001E1EC238|nr:RING-H2 finger protein ATL7-like [Corylus avellana]
MPQIDSVPSSTSRSVTIEKQYQALIVLIPVSIAAIILLLFYVFYLRRGGGLRARRASTENNNDMSNPLEFGLRKDIAAMLPAAALKDSFNSRDPQCSVCLGNYQEDDKLQEIPECGHIFHVDCIGRWLTTHTTCPLCRLSLLSSMETPELRLEPIDDVDHHHLDTSQQ